MMIDGGIDRGDDAELLRMFERKPKRPLASHSRSGDRHGTRPDSPAPGHQRHHFIQQPLLRRPLGIEFRADLARPPGWPAVRTDAGEAGSVQDLPIIWQFAKRLAVGVVKKKQRETERLAGGLAQIDRLAADVES